MGRCLTSMRDVRKAPFVSDWKRKQSESVMRNESEYWVNVCLKKEKMNERKESERCSSFEALVCFFCGFSRDASLDVWMKFRRSSDSFSSRRDWDQHWSGSLSSSPHISASFHNHYWSIRPLFKTLEILHWKIHCALEPISRRAGLCCSFEAPNDRNKEQYKSSIQGSACIVIVWESRSDW